MIGLPVRKKHAGIIQVADLQEPSEVSLDTPGSYNLILAGTISKGYSDNDLKSHLAVHRGSMVIWLSDIGAEDARAVAGGKGASLAQMTLAGLPVPPGFVVSAEALRLFLGSDGVALILRLLSDVEINEPQQLSGASKRICEWMAAQSIPAKLRGSIEAAYEEFPTAANNAARVAVRSSGINEDSEAASFAGQQETFLNVCGIDAVVRKVVECWMSFFSPRAIFYRGEKGLLTDTSMAVIVQEMVQAEKSGVMFTVDPIHRNPDHIVIEAVYGLGEGIVSGMITPDHYVVHRKQDSLVREVVAEKSIQVEWDSSENATRERPVEKQKRDAAVLTKHQLMQLRDLGLQLENHFGRAQDVEWCSRQDQFFLLQSRPITTL